MNALKKKALLVLLLLFFVSLISAFWCQKLSFSYDFESFFPDSQADVSFYKQYRKTFGYDNEFVLLALESKKGIFEQEFLKKADTLAKQLKRITYVKEVVWLGSLKRSSLQGFASTQTPLLHLYKPSLYADDSVYMYENTPWKHTFFSENGQSLCLYIKTEDGLSKKKSDILAQAITKAVSQQNFESCHSAGRIFAQAVFLQKLQKQFVLFLLISIFFVSILLWLSFKKIQAVWLPLSLILMSILITFGCMAALGKTIDIMAVVIPTMIFVAGMSDVIHFYTKFSEETAAGSSTKQTLSLIFQEVAKPTFLTLISTVVGFLSLAWSGIKPIREFGLYTSLGIVVAFVLTYTYLPAMLLFLPDKKKKENTKPNTALRIDSLFFKIIRNGKSIACISLLLAVLSIWGATGIKTNQKLLDDLSNSEPIKKDFLFFEEQYGGVRPLEIAIDVRKENKTIFNYEVLAQIQKVDSFVNKTYAGSFSASPASLVKAVHQAYDGVYVFPTDSADFYRDVRFITQNKNNKEVKKIIANNGKQSRISTKIKDVGSLEMTKRNEKLNQFIRTYTDTNTVHFTLTGAAHLIDLNNDYLVENTLQGLLTGVFSLALLTFFLHRSIKMVLVFLIPNIIPLLLMAGLMGLVGIPLKASTAIFFSIAFGIATDDTIHFISRFKLELEKNTSALRAFKHTYSETGKPVFITTLILLGGFVSLTLSDFESIRLFGLLTCLTLVVALAAEIALLPVLLMWLFKRKKTLPHQTTSTTSSGK
ncbi:MAG: MMPL family transporter [Bacteroidetes bacterium]|nr:MMPL family transporter [Bacteroidota bacterium]